MFIFPIWTQPILINLSALPFTHIKDIRIDCAAVIITVDSVHFIIRHMSSEYGFIVFLLLFYLNASKSDRSYRENRPLLAISAADSRKAQRPSLSLCNDSIQIK